MERLDITPPRDLAILTQLQADLENCIAAMHRTRSTEIARSLEYQFRLKQYVQAETLLRRYAYVLTDDERCIWEQHNGTINKINREEGRRG